MADASPAAAPTVIFKKRAGRANLKKRAATPPSASDSDYSSAEDEETGSRIKRRRKAGITTSTSAITKPTRDLGKSTQYAGDRSAAITNLDDATKTSNWFHADEAARVAGEGGDAAEVEKDGTYKGAKGYGNFIQKNPDKLGKSVGPVKAPTNMRMITLVDFAPDVCKDYKQTGFVSFLLPTSITIFEGYHY
jgi:RING finger protein 113A